MDYRSRLDAGASSEDDAHGRLDRRWSGEPSVSPSSAAKIASGLAKRAGDAVSPLGGPRDSSSVSVSPVKGVAFRDDLVELTGRMETFGAQPSLKMLGDGRSFNYRDQHPVPLRAPDLLDEEPTSTAASRPAGARPTSEGPVPTSRLIPSPSAPGTGQPSSPQAQPSVPGGAGQEPPGLPVPRKSKLQPLEEDSEALATAAAVPNGDGGPLPRGALEAGGPQPETGMAVPSGTAVLASRPSPGPPGTKPHTPRRNRNEGSDSRPVSLGSLSESESSPSTTAQWRESYSSPARTDGPAESVEGDRVGDAGDGYSLTPSPTTAYPVVREYVHGVLMSEAVKNGVIDKRSLRRRSGEQKRPGETIYKGHRSYDLMCNLQLGIRHSVGSLTAKLKRPVQVSDFRVEAEQNFPRAGSKSTPPHQSTDFKWKDYCPLVFRHLREMFNIDAAEYMLSLCGDDALRELSSPGKSGSVFYLSKDDRFIIKTMRRTEVKVLLRMLQSYYEHVRLYENTLVTKFFGLHRVKPFKGGRVVRFVVMGNMFCSDLRIHRRFDLKGSSQGRSADRTDFDENTTLKDNDLDMVFKLEEGWRDRLLLQIEHDCKFMEEQRIMDYSLLLGVHFRATSFLEPMGDGPVVDIEEDPPTAITELEDELSNSSRGKDASVKRMPRPMRTETMRPVHGTNGCTAEINLALGRPRVQLGINMAATALPLDEVTKQPDLSQAYDVVLYFGIIDVLQEYDLKKQLEHTYKAMHFDSHSISAVDPSLYSHRFQSFVCKTFA